MKKIDFNTWKRKDTFKFFSNYSNPYYNISFNLDITELKKYTDNHNISFYKAMIYCVSEAVNKTEEFLYLYKDGDIYKIDRREPSYTYLPKDSDSFKFIYTKSDKGLNKFIEEASIAENNAYKLVDSDKESDELIYITCLPWLDMTGFTNAHNLENKLESIPIFAWGKYKKENDNWIINLSLEINHAFIDGVHIKKFVDNFNKTVKELEG